MEKNLLKLIISSITPLPISQKSFRISSVLSSPISPNTINQQCPPSFYGHLSVLKNTPKEFWPWSPAQELEEWVRLHDLKTLTFFVSLPEHWEEEEWQKSWVEEKPWWRPTTPPNSFYWVEISFVHFRPATPSSVLLFISREAWNTHICERNFKMGNDSGCFESYLSPGRLGIHTFVTETLNGKWFWLLWIISQAWNTHICDRDFKMGNNSGCFESFPILEYTIWNTHICVFTFVNETLKWEMILAALNHFPALSSQHQLWLIWFKFDGWNLGLITNVKSC